MAGGDIAMTWAWREPPGSPDLPPQVEQALWLGVASRVHVNFSWSDEAWGYAAFPLFGSDPAIGDRAELVTDDAKALREQLEEVTGERIAARQDPAQAGNGANTRTSGSDPSEKTGNVLSIARMCRIGPTRHGLTERLPTTACHHRLSVGVFARPRATVDHCSRHGSTERTWTSGVGSLFQSACVMKTGGDGRS